MSAEPIRIFTVGHGTRTDEGLIEVLADADIERLIDVRRYPASRRNPQFDREALEPSLPAAGISYEWRGETLGGRRSSTSDSPNVALTNEAFRGYADHMRTETFVAELRQIETLARRSRLALMCAETLWWRCHRRLIADFLHARGADVIHLLEPGKDQPHRPMDVMRLDAAGLPVYGVGATANLLR